MMRDLPPIEEMYGTKRADAPAVDKQDLILRANALRDEILRRVGGDKSAARDVLKNITADAPAVDKQDLILRALDALLRERAASLPRESPHSERLTRLITEIDGVVR